MLSDWIETKSNCTCLQKTYFPIQIQTDDKMLKKMHNYTK